jgi:sirohydrochlorin cobaltochelatase
MHTTTRAVILFGHGSRDPLWRVPIESVAQRVTLQQPQHLVRCAYLELTEPDLPTVASELIAAGAVSIWVLPMFLGKGRHAREDLPAIVAELRLAHPDVMFELRPSVGEDERVLNLLVTLALEAAGHP